jgi:hypothetical protein
VATPYTTSTTLFGLFIQHGSSLDTSQPSVPDYHKTQSDSVDSLSITRPQLIRPLIPYIDPECPNLSSRAIGLSHWRIIFPLSPDHHLLTLCQYNVLRATLTNLSILSLLDSIPIECSAARSLIPLLPTPSCVPPTFAPTPLQLAVRHDFWIDALPVPEMRDNLIRLQGTYDADELCADLCDGLYDGFDEVELRGMLVWSDPWRCDGWEVTEGFARKWGFVLKGCDGLMEATNRYRAARGEDRMVVEV